MTMKEVYETAHMVAWFRNMAERGLMPQEQYCLQTVPASKRDSVLDIGIGGGRTTGPLSEAFRNYVGIDYSGAMVAAAKSFFPGADIRTMDARKLDFDRGFDCVIFSFNGIDSIDFSDRDQVFKQVGKVLKPEGYFIYSTHNINHPRVSVWAKNFFVKELLQAWPRIRPIVRSFLNRLSKFRHQSWNIESGSAVVNDPGGNFGYLNTYVDVAAEIETTLRRNGFRAVTTIGNSRKDAGYGVEDAWVYVVAQLAAPEAA